MQPGRRYRQQVQPTARPGFLPAPIGGLNTISPGSAMPPEDCWALYNMVAAERGLRVRLGSRAWCNGLGGAVRTQLPFTGSTASDSRLFAVTVAGIFDVTSQTAGWRASTAYAIGDVVVNDTGKVYTCDTDGTSDASGGPTGTGSNIVDGTTRWDYTSTKLVLAFASPTGNAGYGVCHVHVTAGGHFLLYWDEVNGYHLYTESTGLWTTGSITGATAANMVFGTVFKGRVWMVERESAKLWYLGLLAISGAATEFSLGTKLRAGGAVRGIWNWTYDGGAGIDDALVAISDGGDVAIYQGTDPSSASTFGMTGVWQVGAIPAGPDIATDVGGDLLVLTRLGILPMSQLVLGRTEPDRYATAKIATQFNVLMSTRADSYGWSMRLHPEDNSLVVTVPDPDGYGLTQLVMSLANKSWSVYRDLDMNCAASFGGKLYFGDLSGNVWVNDGNVDNVPIGAASYDAIQYAGLSAFQNAGSPTQKQIQMIRPRFIGQSAAPSFSVNARYDFDASELGVVTFAGGAAGGWDSGEWDEAVWGGEYSPTSAVRGATGIGAYAAIAWRGASVDRTVLIGFDYMATSGGFL